MNRSESKYFYTALCMDEALISLLKEKDLEYITVKEICEKAGVNRSTFYLHYETIADLIDEAAETVGQRFQSCFSEDAKGIAGQVGSADVSDLVLITRAYLDPSLSFFRRNKTFYRRFF